MRADSLLLRPLSRKTVLRYYFLEFLAYARWSECVDAVGIPQPPDNETFHLCAHLVCSRAPTLHYANHAR
jgi:hypothetical protein